MEVPGGAPRELDPRRTAELLGVADRLLQMPPDDLVELEHCSSMLLKPPGETLVKLTPHRHGQPVVGGVPDQQVPEAKRIIALKRRRMRPNQFLAHERREPQLDLGCETPHPAPQPRELG
jgi:hypothetical protein